jgi:hypothetical protein
MIKLAQFSNFQQFGMIPLNFKHFKQVNSKSIDTSKNTSIAAEPEKVFYRSTNFSLRFDTNTGWYDQKLIPAQPCLQPMEM